jgi:hypothetical protein
MDPAGFAKRRGQRPEKGAGPELDLLYLVCSRHRRRNRRRQGSGIRGCSSAEPSSQPLGAANRSTSFLRRLAPIVFMPSRLLKKATCCRNA